MKEVNCITNLMYKPIDYSMAIPLVFEKNGDITRISGVTSCRELLTGSIICIINGNYSKLIHTRCRMLLFCSVSKPTHLKHALTVINSFEDYANISHTTAVKVNFVNRKDITGYMFSISEKWLRASPIFSMYLLLLKTTLKEASLLKKNNINNFDDYATNVLNDKLFSGKVNPYGSSDRTYTKRTIKFWPLIVKNIDKLFPTDVPIKKRFLSGYAFGPNINASMSIFGIDNYVLHNDKYNYKYKRHSKFIKLAQEANIL